MKWCFGCCLTTPSCYLAWKMCCGNCQICSDRRVWSNWYGFWLEEPWLICCFVLYKCYERAEDRCTCLRDRGASLNDSGILVVRFEVSEVNRSEMEISERRDVEVIELENDKSENDKSEDHEVLKTVFR